MTLIASVISSVESTMNIVKALGETAFSMKNAVLKEKIAELMNLLADQKIKMAEIKNVILNKEEEIVLLKKQIAQINSNEKPRHERGVYKFGVDEGSYCTRCWDSKMKKFQVTETIIPGTRQCPECQSFFS